MFETISFYPPVSVRSQLALLAHRLRSIVYRPEGERLALEARFLDVVNNHQGIITRICRSFAFSDSDFEDLRQDAMVNIWIGISSYRNEALLSTWIYRVTLNTCVSTYRRRGKGEVIPVSDKTDSAGQVSQETRFESAQWINSLLSTLSVADHSMMAMWLEDLSYEEIAQVMGINKNTVATRLHRAKLKLKKLIETSKY